MTSLNKNGNIEHKLWLGQEWYLRVDSKGYCLSESAEGALGYVVKIDSSVNIKAHRALKIPRLLGDTHRENAYICQLMEQEVEATQKVINEPGDFGVGKLLLGAAFGGAQGSPLRGPIVTASSVEGAGEWSGSIVLVRFEKGKKPRFCLVNKKEDGKLGYFPPEANFDNSVPQLVSDEYDKLKQASRADDVRFFVPEASDEEEKSFDISKAVTFEWISATWFAGLPSVVYPWAPFTLQEAISRVIDESGKRPRNPRNFWDIDQHLELARNICDSLLALHGINLLHCDLRPANIVVAGSVESPSFYFVSDYGSFSLDQQTQAGAQSAGQLDAGPATKLPVVVGERASAFYAPERRLGREREAADTAVILRDNNVCKIVLGWKQDFYGPNNKLDLVRIKRYAQEAHQADRDKSYPDSVLLAGDRIQIREFIFELNDTEQRYEDKQILPVRTEYWQIYHGKIAVRADKPLEADTELPVPRTVELLKWSAATDLYGLGTLLLYSIFRNTGSNFQDGSKDEDEFREMLTQLNNRQYFDAIWLELDWLRYLMELTLTDSEVLAKLLDYSSLPDEEIPQTFADVPFYSFLSRQRRRNDPHTLFDAAVAYTNRVTQTAPGVHRIVTGVGNNVAVFVFVLHFALSCIHRQVHLDKKTRETTSGWAPDWKQELPFCENRHEMPEPRFPAKQALARINYLRKLLEKNEIKTMVATSAAIREYDPRPDYSVRVALDQLRTAIGRIQTAVNSNRIPELLSPFKREIISILGDIPTSALEPQRADENNTRPENDTSTDENIG